MATYEEVLSQIEGIRTEVLPEANTAHRIGGAMKDTLLFVEDNRKSLSADIKKEKAAREAGDTTLQANIDAEATTRQQAMEGMAKNVKSMIDEEKAARETGDTALTEALDTKTEAEDTSEVINSIEETLVTDALRKSAQILTDSEKAQARKNIGAASTADYAEALSGVQQGLASEVRRATEAESEISIKVEETKTKIDNLNIEVNGSAKLDLSQYESTTVYVDGTTQGTAKWLLNNNSYKGMLIPCVVGATYHITRNDAEYAVCAFVKSIGNNGDIVDFAYIGTGNIGRFTVKDETSWNDIVAPEGSAFLWVATTAGAVDRTPKEITFTLESSIKNKLSKLEDNVSLVHEDIDKINEDINATDALVDEVRNDMYGTETVDGEIDLSSGVETFYIDKQLVGEAYWMNNASYKGKIFPCIVGASYHIVKQESQSAQYAFIKEVGNAGDLVNFSVEKNGYGKHVLRGTSSDDTYNDLVAEEGTKYIWVGTTSGGNDITPLQITYHKDGIKSVKDSVAQLEGKLRAQDDSLFKSVAHRGYVGSQILSTPTANQLAPENTIPAYILARKMGYKYVETDIHFTSDNIPCLLHDTTIDRTSNGSGNLAEMTLAQAKNYDFSKLCPYMQDVKIPTLDEFLIVCRDLNLHPYLEISWFNHTYVEIVVDTVRKRHMINDVTFISTVLDTLKKVQELAPTARLGRLPQYGVTVDAVFVEETKTLQNGQNEVFIDSNTRTDDEVSACIEGEIPLEVWVIETEEALRQLPDYVSGITTDVIIAGDIFKKGYGL